jgi:uncharacterized membrane protein YfcA
MITFLLSVLGDTQTWLFALIGIVAQMFDGVLGMGFGVVSSTCLTLLGFPRMTVSAAVNGAKIITGAASGLSHAWYRNVGWPLFAILATGGLIGGVLGSLLISRTSGRYVGPVISAYLIFVGFYIIWRAIQEKSHAITSVRTAAVGFAGGALEAISGVWGPLVTSSLVAMGVEPRYAVGTGNLAETIVAVTVFSMLAGHVGLEAASHAVIGLVIGAVVASPIAARLTHRADKKRLMIAVGVLVIASSVIRLLRDAGWLG